MAKFIIEQRRMEALRENTEFLICLKTGEVRRDNGKFVARKGELVLAEYVVEVDISVGDNEFFSTTEVYYNCVSAYVLEFGLTGDLAMDEARMLKYCNKHKKVKNLVVEIKSATCNYKYEDCKYIWKGKRNLYENKRLGADL